MKMTLISSRLALLLYSLFISAKGFQGMLSNISSLNLEPSIILADPNNFYFEQNNSWYYMTQQSNIPSLINTSIINYFGFWITPESSQLVSAYISFPNTVTIATVDIPNIVSMLNISIQGMYDGFIQILYYSQYVLLFGEYIMVVDLNSESVVCNTTVGIYPPTYSFVYSNEILYLNRNGSYFYSCSNSQENSYTTQELNITAVLPITVNSETNIFLFVQNSQNTSLMLYILDSNLNADNQYFSLSYQNLIAVNITLGVFGQVSNQFMVFWGNNSFNSLCLYTLETISPLSITTNQCLDFYLTSTFNPVIGTSNVLISNIFGSIIIQLPDFIITNTYSIIPPINFSNGAAITPMSYTPAGSSQSQYFQLCTTILYNPTQQIVLIDNNPFIYSLLSPNLLSAIYLPQSSPGLSLYVPLPLNSSEIIAIQLSNTNNSQFNFAIRVSNITLIINSQGQVEATLPECDLIFMGTQYLYCSYQNATITSYSWNGNLALTSSIPCSIGTLAKINESTLACISLGQQSIQIYNVYTQEMVWSVVIPLTALFLSQTYVTHAWYPLNFDLYSSQLSGYMVILPETLYIFSIDGSSFNLSSTNFFVLPNGSLFFPAYSTSGLAYNSSVINFMDWNDGNVVSLYSPPDNYGLVVILLTILLLALVFFFDRLQKNREQKILNFKETLFEMAKKN